jgi:hypothetical protein
MTFSRTAKMNDVFATRLSTAQAARARAYERMREAQRRWNELQEKSSVLAKAYEGLAPNTPPADMKKAEKDFEAAYLATRAQGKLARRYQREYHEAEAAVAEAQREAAVIAAIDRDRQHRR